MQFQDLSAQVPATTQLDGAGVRGRVGKISVSFLQVSAVSPGWAALSVSLGALPLMSPGQSLHSFLQSSISSDSPPIGLGASGESGGLRCTSALDY